MRRRLGLLGWRVMFVVLQLLILLSCNRERPLATLVAKQGDVQRAAAVRQNEWSIAAIDATFILGDALRTAQRSSATLELDDGCKLQVKPDTLIRFSSERPKAGKQAFEVEAGQVLVETGATGVELVTGVGRARLQAGSKLSIGRTSEGLRFEITVGKAQLEADGSSRALEVGQAYLVSIGNAVIERPDAAGSAQPRGSIAEPPAPSTVLPQSPTGSIQAQIFGSGVAQKAASEQEFRPLLPGNTGLLPGTTVRVDAKSRVELAHDGASVTLSGKGTYLIRSDAAFVELQSGSLSTTGATRIAVPGGVIETTRESATSVESPDRNRSLVRVARGRATITSKQEATAVEQGQEATIGSDGATMLAGRGLGYADFTLDVGAAVTVHDPKPPTAVRFAFGTHCPAGGIVRTKAAKVGNFASGQGSVSLALNVGSHEYTLHCFGEQGAESSPAARGTITIVQDAGTRPVPSKPPSTSVNIDGRRYTVTYQNQLPNLSVVWPNAPPSSNYTLIVESRGGAKTVKSRSPNYTFKSGTLSEGSHQLHFEGGGKFSRHTKVEIVFDNAAPKASLSTPVETNVGAGGELTVVGVAQPGWSVEIGANRVEQDGQQRFVQKVTMPASERALAIKLTHPVRGTHIYLRRSTRPND